LAERWHELGPWVVIVLLPLAALAFRRGWLLAVLLVVGSGAALSPEPVMAFGWQDLWQRPDQRAAGAFADGDLERARELATTSSRAGSAAYRLGDFDDAAERFGSADGAVDHYNRGNALARGGRLEDAIAAYDAALERDPGLEDAAYNKAQVEAALEALEREQQAPQQSSQSGESGDAADASAGQTESRQQSGPQSSMDDSQQEAAQGDAAQGSSESSEQQQSESGGGEPEDSAQQSSGDESRADGDQASGADAAPSEAQNEPWSQNGTDGEGGSTAETEGASTPEQSERAAADYRAEAAAAQAGAQADGTQSAALESEASDDGAGEDRGLTAEEREARQAADQWLRRIPDDPAELLRRKFLYQYQARQTDEDVLATGQPW
jgi:Ca-activated chloride channel family protein